jgi:tRNA threonylcarbamoyladenosine biosynthesis protein TsaB
MKILSVDTSTKNFSLSIAQDEKIIASLDVILKDVLSDSIIPNIRTLLKKAKATIESIDGYAIGLGPGSFTSLRVGLSTVKGLAFSLHKPIVGVSSLDIIAAAVKEEKDIAVVCDARRDLIYAALYKKKGSNISLANDYLLTDIDSFLKKVKKDTIFTGDGIKLYKDKIRGLGKKITFAPETFWYPQAKYLSPLALKHFKEKKVSNMDSLVPLYLYPENCQVTPHAKK